MTGKDSARQVIDALPDSATMDEIIHALYVNVKFARGVSEIRNGQGVSHEDAKQKLEKSLKWFGRHLRWRMLSPSLYTSQETVFIRGTGQL